MMTDSKTNPNPQPDFFDPPPPSPIYPSSPGWKRRETSQQAAADITAGAPTLRARCLAALRDRARTADEIADFLEVSNLAVRPTRAESPASAEVTSALAAIFGVIAASTPRVVWSLVPVVADAPSTS